jgi:hypothetical protein
MSGTTESLRWIAIGIVADCQPCRPNQLVKRLRSEYGASHRAANETLLTLIRDGRLRRTFSGKLVLP